MCYFHPYILFDEHIFQMGWFNHQAVLVLSWNSVFVDQIWELITIDNSWPPLALPTARVAELDPEQMGSIPFALLEAWALWVFPKIGVPQNGWFMMENPIKKDDLGENPLFLETPLCFLGVSFLGGLFWGKKHVNNYYRKYIYIYTSVIIFVFLIFGQFFYDFWVSCISLIFSFIVFPHESNIYQGAMVWCVGAVRSGYWARRRILHLCPLPCCLNASPLQGTKRTLTSLKIQTGPRVNPKNWEDSFPESKRTASNTFIQKKNIVLKSSQYVLKGSPTPKCLSRTKGNWIRGSGLGPATLEPLILIPSH